MGDEEKLETMKRLFEEVIRGILDIQPHEFPAFAPVKGYYIIRKGDEQQGFISDAWDFFKLGWETREGVDERTVKGWGNG